MQERKSLLVSFEKDTLLECRRILFANGVSPNELFCHIMYLLNTNDQRIYDLINEVKKNKIEKIKKGEKVKYSADNLYDAIEEMLRK